MRKFLIKNITSKGNWKNSHGGALVEFAIVLPLFFLLLFGMIEFGIFLFDKHIITNASREGARAGIQQASPPGVAQIPNRFTIYDIETVVYTYCSNHLVSFGINNQQLPTVETNPDPTINPKPDPPCASTGDVLEVQVRYQYKYLIFPNIAKLFGNENIANPTITATTTMVCE